MVLVVTFALLYRIISNHTNTMAKIKITFSECEHQEDLDNYADNVRESGGTILEESVNIDTEEGMMLVEVEVEDKQTFVNKLKETDCYDFII